MMRLAMLLSVTFALVLPAVAATVGDPVAARSEEAQAHYEAGRYDEALRAYQDALVERPESAALHLNVGAAMYQLGDHENALEEFSRAAASSDADVATRGFYNKGNTHFQLQDYGAAAEAYQQALQRTPDDQDAKANLELALRLMQQPPSSQQGDSEDSEDSDDSEQDEQGESQPESSESDEQQPQDGQPDQQPEDPAETESDHDADQTPDPSDPESGEDESEANQAPEQGDESETMDEEEAEQLLDALNDRDEQSQKRRYRARRRSDDAQDW